MRIIDSNKKAVLNLESVKTGQLFRINDNYFIKGLLSPDRATACCWSLMTNKYRHYFEHTLIDEVYPNAFIDTGK